MNIRRSYLGDSRQMQGDTKVKAISRTPYESASHRIMTELTAWAEWLVGWGDESPSQHFPETKSVFSTRETKSH